ncbi:MAG: hypothetical protein H6560_20400 [Lewinellaceae bacterium]|nr:hypothetical protein [Lewinellaceae bacterium]
MKKDNTDYIDRLRREVWKRAMGNERINPSSRYCRRISHAIEEQVGEVLHKDTIRNFLRGNNEPQARIRDIYATFVLNGNAAQPCTYDEFILWVEGQSFSAEKEKTDRRRQTFPLPGRSLKRAAVIIAIAIGVFVAALFLPPVLRPEPTNLFYRFTHSNLEQLEADGWFLFPDSINHELWGRYPESGYLTLETFPGDSFLDNRDYKPWVINILARAFECGSCCEIEVKITDFTPGQRYQQAGFFLFYGHSVVPSLRMAYAWEGVSVATNIFIRDDTYSNRTLFPTSAFNNRRKILSALNYAEGVRLDSVVLKARVQGNQYFLLHKIDDGDFIALRSQSLNLPPPRYIGLAAFQGRPEIPYPIYPQADTLQVNFEYVRIRPCPEE